MPLHVISWVLSHSLTALPFVAHPTTAYIPNMARYHEGSTERAAAKQAFIRQRYSLYLPVTAKHTQRKTSVSNRSDDKNKKERAEISRASLDPSGKRRGTMRSREHDEEAEMLQRALEESQRDAQGGNGKRNGKRTRDDSNEE